MAKVIEGVHVLDFDEWKRRPEVIAMEEEFEDCDECHGDGTHECDCGHVHECSFCDGKGKTSTLQDEYNSQIKEELKKLVLWRDGLAKKVPDMVVRNAKQ